MISCGSILPDLAKLLFHRMPAAAVTSSPTTAGRDVAGIMQQQQQQQKDGFVNKFCKKCSEQGDEGCMSKLRRRRTQDGTWNYYY